MAMFGKSYTATPAYDDKKSSKDDTSGKKKDKGILNMPISTNIQISKKDNDMKTRQQPPQQNGFDPFDPFDPFPIRVGERVQVDQNGNIVGFGAEAEEDNKIAVEEIKEVTDASVEQSVDKSIQTVKQEWNIDNVPIAPAGEIQLSGNDDKQTANVSASVNTSTVAPVAGEVKVIEPKVTAETLAEVTKQVTESVTKAINEQITETVTKTINEQVTETVTRTINEQLTKQIVAEISNQLGNISTGSADSTIQAESIVNLVNENVTKQLEEITGKLTDSLNGVSSKLEASISDTNNANSVSASAEIADLKEEIQAINESIAAVKTVLEKPEEELSESEQTARISAEVEREKNKMFSHTVVPLLVSMIEARENILRMSQVYKEKGTDIPSGVMKGYAFDLGDALEKHKVEIYQSSKGDKFNSAIHKKIGTVAATKEEQDGTIAASLSCGYKYNGEVIFQEKVDTYFMKK